MKMIQAKDKKLIRWWWWDKAEKMKDEGMERWDEEGWDEKISNGLW